MYGKMKPQFIYNASKINKTISSAKLEIRCFGILITLPEVSEYEKHRNTFESEYVSIYFFKNTSNKLTSLRLICFQYSTNSCQ